MASLTSRSTCDSSKPKASKVNPPPIFVASNNIDGEAPLKFPPEPLKSLPPPLFPLYPFPLLPVLLLPLVLPPPMDELRNDEFISLLP